MSYIITDNKHYKNIASAIRSKLRVDTKYAPEEMASAIGNIPSSADGTNDPVAGIYYNDPDENGNPTVVKLVGMSSASCPNVFTLSMVQKNLKKVEFVNCHFTNFQDYAFESCTNLEQISIPEETTTLGMASFRYCNNLKFVESTDTLKTIKTQAFTNNYNLITVVFPKVVTIGAQVFNGCSKLTDITLSNTLKDVSNSTFMNCNALTNVTLGDDFDCNNLNLSPSTRYSHDTILQWFDALKDKTGEAPYTLTIGNTNLKKLTKEQIEIATKKNWIIA